MTGRPITRRLGLAALVALLLLVLPGTGAKAAPIGGYQTNGSGQVFSAFPTLPGFTIVQAPFEGTVALTSANLQAGGQAFARASILWPGDVIAGLGSLLGVAASGLPVAIPNYPIRAEAHEYTGPSQDSAIPGIRMTAFGSTERADAQADVGALVMPAIMSVASSSSHTDSRQSIDKASTTVEVSLHGISLAGGQITIDAFKATSATASDGVKPTGKGTAVVTGLVIGGVPATIDSAGIHANGQSSPDAEPNKQIAAVLAASGFSLALTPSDVKIQGGTVEAGSPALIITAPIPNVAFIPAGSMTIVLGATHARTAASAGSDVTSDLTDVSTPVGAVEGASFGSVGDTGGGGSSSGTLPDLSASGTTGATLSPSGAAPSTRSDVALATAATPSDYHFRGVSPGLVLLLMLLGFAGVLLIRRYMRRLLSIGSQ